jgi:hypothetical protein
MLEVVARILQRSSCSDTESQPLSINTFTAERLAGQRFSENPKSPYVLKADGLAAERE